MFQWLDWLLDYSAFITRDHCGEWGPWLIYLYQFFNFSIAIAYFGIPLALCWLSNRLPAEFKHRTTITLFIAFILSCGIHHISQIFSFYKPAYRLFTLLDGILAVVSVATALYLPFVVIQITRKE